MSVILAIEPDRRQAAHLTAIVRQRVGAELILADTTEGAIEAIGSRIPDMVLVPTFLAPQDDAALAAALRVIAAAAHVRTLTIPLLSSGEKGPVPGGILARWRRIRAASPAPDGCDPAVFAEQIAAYLREAAAERVVLEVVETVTAETATLPEAPPIELAAPIAKSPELDVTETVAVEAGPLAETLPIELAMPTVEAPSARPLAAASMPTENETGAIDDLRPAPTSLSSEGGDVPAVASDERFTDEAVGAWTIDIAADEPTPLAKEMGDKASVPDAAAVEETVVAEAAPPPFAHRPAYLEWTELVASLRQDIERRRPERVPAPSVREAEPAPSTAAVRGSQCEPTHKRPRKQVKPMQDEWGFFDPEQCGFAALLAKLEEITVSPDPAGDPDAQPPA